MSAPMDCSTLMELAPELVVDSLDGELRAEALAHLASCRTCRTEVTELADTADALTLLAPSAEPPPGFVDRVLDAMSPPAPAPVPIESKRRRWRTGHVIAAIAAAVALAVAGTVAVEQHEHGGGGLALNARTLRTIHMIAMDKSSVGDAYVSTGPDPWILVSLDYGFTSAPTGSWVSVPTAPSSTSEVCVRWMGSGLGQVVSRQPGPWSSYVWWTAPAPSCAAGMPPTTTA